MKIWVLFAGLIFLCGTTLIACMHASDSVEGSSEENNGTDGDGSDDDDDDDDNNDDDNDNNTDDNDDTDPVDPEDPESITDVIVVPDATLIDEPLPVTQDDESGPVVVRSEENVAYSAGSDVLLPLDYESPTKGNVVALVFAVDGSDRHFRLDFPEAGSSGTLLLPIFIPERVLNGVFCILVKLIDDSGTVGPEVLICISVTSPLTCDTLKVSGGEGLTSTIHTMNGGSGYFKLDYETYTVKDRIDVFKDGAWMAGTGSEVERSSIRTALDCSEATEELGYVGEQGQFKVRHNGSADKIEVVISGCENNGTAWEYTAHCPTELIDEFLIFSLSVTNEADLPWFTELSPFVITPNGNTIGFGESLGVDEGHYDPEVMGFNDRVYFSNFLYPGKYEFFVKLEYSDGVGPEWEVEVSQGGSVVQTEKGAFDDDSPFETESEHFIYQYQP